MTSENTDSHTPSWQYVPPASPTEGSTVDATRYMKGAPRRGQTSPDTTNTHTENYMSNDNTPENTNSSPAVSTASDQSSAPTTSADAPAQIGSAGAVPTTQETNGISYDTQNRPAATEYRTDVGSGCAPQREASRQPRREGGYNRDNRGPRNDNRRAEGRDNRYNSGDSPAYRSSYYERSHEDRTPASASSSSPSYTPHSSRGSHAGPSAPSSRKGLGSWIRSAWISFVSLFGGKKPLPSTDERRPYSSEHRGGSYRGGGRRYSRGGRGGRGGYNRGTRQDGRGSGSNSR